MNTSAKSITGVLRSWFSREKVAAVPDLSPKPRTFSSLSSAAIPNSIFHAADFLLGAGVVIIQPSSGKVVIVNEGEYWFLPKGRKDVGESLEYTAMREGYEESGYRCEPFPLYMFTRQPRGPNNRSLLTKITEPLFITTMTFGTHKPMGGGEYLTFWYIAQIGPDAVREENTGMQDEAGYVAHLLPIEEAQKLLADDDIQSHIMMTAWETWKKSVEYEERQQSGSQKRSH